MQVYVSSQVDIPYFLLQLITIIFYMFVPNTAAIKDCLASYWILYKHSHKIVKLSSFKTVYTLMNRMWLCIACAKIARVIECGLQSTYFDCIVRLIDNSSRPWARSVRSIYWSSRSSVAPTIRWDPCLQLQRVMFEQWIAKKLIRILNTSYFLWRYIGIRLS